MKLANGVKEILFQPSKENKKVTINNLSAYISSLFLNKNGFILHIAFVICISFSFFCTGDWTESW
jgi:hypothetical protein